MKPVKTRIDLGILCVAAACALIFMGAISTVFAHCDTMNGPVISEAKVALEKGDVTPVLKWIKKENEEEIRTAFARTLAVRAQGSDAKGLADRYFLETLVRLHRAGEGEPYTGIKDEPLDPIIALADKALADGSADEMVKRINEHIAEAIREKFGKALEARKNKDKSVESGREFVEAYVTYTHFVEGIHSAIVSAPSHHSETANGGNAVDKLPVDQRH
jgi:Family of unknown function (DUF6448)